MLGLKFGMQGLITHTEVQMKQAFNLARQSN